MGKSQRDKGNRGERFVVNKLKAAGFEDATRNYADKVDRLGVDVYAGSMNIQVKNYSGSVPMSKWKEIKDDFGVRVLVSNDTSDRQMPWMITMSLDNFLTIVQDIIILYDRDKWNSLVPPF